MAWQAPQQGTYGLDAQGQQVFNPATQSDLDAVAGGWWEGPNLQFENAGKDTFLPGGQRYTPLGYDQTTKELQGGWEDPLSATGYTLGNISSTGDILSTKAYTPAPSKSDPLGNLIMAALMAGVGGLAFSGAGLGAMGAEGAGAMESMATLGGDWSAAAGPTGMGIAEGAGSATGAGSTLAGWSGTNVLPEVAADWSAAAGPTGMGIMEGAGSYVSPWAKFFSSPLATLFGSGNGAAGATGAMPWGSPGNLMNMGTGLYGLFQSEQMKKRALAEAAKADTWGTSGGRQLATNQAMQLMQDPSMITSMPGYKAMLQGVQRKMGTMPGSGNMMAALADASGNFYQNTLQQLSGLGGAQFNPANSAQLVQSGQNTSANLALNSLGLLGKTAQSAGWF